MTVANPKKTDKTFINPKAEMAPVNTRHLACCIARIAAMKNVLSPSSDTIMTQREATNP